MSTQSFYNVSVANNAAILGNTQVQNVTATGSIAANVMTANSATIPSLTSTTLTASDLVLNGNANITASNLIVAQNLTCSNVKVGATTINASELATLDNCTQNIHTRFNNSESNIAMLQSKTTDLSSLFTTSTFSRNLAVGETITATGTIIANGGLTCNGTANVNGNVIANGQQITPAALGYLAGSTQPIEGRFSNIESINANQTSNITALQSKTSDLTKSSTYSTFANGLHVNDQLTVTNLSILNGGLTCNTLANINCNVLANGITVTPQALSMVANCSQNIEQRFLSVDTVNMGQGNAITALQSSMTGAQSNISALQTKCTDIAYSGGVTTFDQDIVCNGNLTCSDAGAEVHLHGRVRICTDGATMPMSNSAGNTDAVGVEFYRNQISTYGELDLLCDSRYGTFGGFGFFTRSMTQDTMFLGLLNVSGFSIPNPINITSSTAQSSLQGVVTLVGDGTLPTANTGTTSGLQTYCSNGSVDLLSCGSTSGHIGKYRFLGSSNTVAPTVLASINESGTFFSNAVSLTANSAGTPAIDVTQGTVQTLQTKTYPASSIASASSASGNTTGSNIYTVTLNPFYSRQITVTTPIAHYVAGASGTASQVINRALTSITCQIKKNGVNYSTPAVISLNDLTQTKSFTVISNGSYAAEQFFTVLQVTFTVDFSSNSDVYTVSYTPSPANSAAAGIVFNTTTATHTTGTNITYNSAGNDGFSTQTHRDSLVTPADRSGKLDVNDLSISNRWLATKPQQPNFDSGWMLAANDTTLTITHNLNTNMNNPTSFRVFFSTTNNPVIGTDIISEVTQGDDRYVIRHLDANTIMIRTQSIIASYYTVATNTWTNATGGYYRVYGY